MRFLFIVFLCYPAIAKAQMKFDFENDSLSKWLQSQENHWSISPFDIISGNYSLHHSFNNPAAGNDQISFPYLQTPDLQSTITWQFSVKHMYLPSSANNWAVFLASDMGANEMTTNSDAEALVIGVNFTGSDDTLKLWKLQNHGAEVVLKTNLNWEKQIALNPEIITITRDASGIFTVCAANPEFPELRDTIAKGRISFWPECNYFGIYYKYSASQDQKLWFDNISVSCKFVTDTIPPKIDSTYLLNNHEIRIYFSEEINPASLVSTSFQLSNNLSIDSIRINNYKTITIAFEQPFEQGKLFTISVNHVADKSGNIIKDASLLFRYYQPIENDIVINEIMADPEPSVGLPSYEYLELYNRSKFAINIEKWKMKVNDQEFLLPHKILEPQAYLILTTKEHAIEFNKWGPIVEVFSSKYTLGNVEGTITLNDSSGKTISFLNFSENWITDAYKKNGGWSIELIDPDNPCNGAQSWHVSKSKFGGTPGMLNSVNSTNSDNIIPALNALAMPNDSTLVLLFTEPVLAEPNFSFQNYKIEVNSIKNIDRYSSYFNSVALHLSNPLESGNNATLQIKKDVCDCALNKLRNDTLVQIQTPELPDSGDVVINEIMAHAGSKSVEFIELFNRSNKPINVGELLIATLDTFSKEVKAFETIAPPGLILNSNEFMVLTRNEILFRSIFLKPFLANIIELSNLPVITDESGSMALLTKNLQIVDQIKYSDKWHFPLLVSTEGVSLERANANISGMVSSNWHSAASTDGYATPGRKNSQVTPAKPNTNNLITIEPDVISPNGDGRNDFTAISINQQDVDAMASLTIFNSAGIAIKYLANKQLLSYNSSYTWDGTTEKGMLQPPVIYVVHLLVITKSGKTTESKKVVVIAPN